MMRRFTKLFMAVAALLSWNALSAQTVVLQENFTTYAGTAATVPAGWTFSYNGNYTTTASSGLSGPNSYKFGVNNATITSPQFSNADSLSFWVKGNGTDTISKLIALESADNITWDTIAVVKPLPTNATGQTRTYPVQPTSQYIRFTYVKSVGNAAFDDFLLKRNPPITALFTNQNVCDGSAMNFTDMSSSNNGSITSWKWMFGEPASGPADTSLLQNPAHTYMGPGNYNVQLIVTNSNNDVDTASMTVTVYANPTANFTASATSGCGQVCVTFTDISTPGTGNITTWMWSLGDASVATSQSLVHCYNQAGVYDIDLTVTDIYGCTSTFSMPGLITVNPVPTAGFTASTSGASVNFSNTVTGGTGSYSYAWDFGDNTPADNSANPSHTYAIDGTYNVCLVVTDAAGCMDTFCQQQPIITTVIPRSGLSEGFSIYPNPSSTGVATLTFGKYNGSSVKIRVYNIIGNTVLERDVNGTNIEKQVIDLSQQPAGNYFVNITAGGETVTRRITIK